MKELRHLMVVVLAAVVAMVALPATGYAGALSAPVVTCTVDTTDSELDLSWTVSTGSPDANKYALQIDCVNDSTSTVTKFKFGASDCGSFGIPPKPECDPNITSLSVPISDLVKYNPDGTVASSAGSGDICTIKVRGLHNKGPNTDPPHATGSITCAALP